MWLRPPAFLRRAGGVFVVLFLIAATTAFAQTTQPATTPTPTPAPQRPATIELLAAKNKWAPNELYAGQCLIARENHKNRLCLDANGKLELVNKHGKSRTLADVRQKDTFLRLQVDGNLVLYNQRMRPLWATNAFTTKPDADVRAYVTGRGVLYLIDSPTDVVWLFPRMPNLNYLPIVNKFNGKCLQGDNSEEDKVVLWDCNGSPKQLWGYDAPTGHFRLKDNPYICLHAKSAAPLTPITMLECAPDDLSVSWVLNGDAITFSANSTLVLDNLQNKDTNGNQVGINTSSGTRNQQWNLGAYQPNIYRLVSDRNNTLYDGSPLYSEDEQSLVYSDQDNGGALTIIHPNGATSIVNATKIADYKAPSSVVLEHDGAISIYDNGGKRRYWSVANPIPKTAIFPYTMGLTNDGKIELRDRSNKLYNTLE
ncbi:hypothetical protein BC832DRAFT_356537 [Gaertneriomyces semiglobifer]|nr:hypothetical protein BC832DRAFT_356537 [Gaertneriomyces semiglobifer]